MNQFKNILYVVEPSVDETAAMARAVSLAANNQANLTVIDVIPALAADMDFEIPISGTSYAELDSAMLAAHRDAIEKLIAPYQSHIDIRYEVLIGRRFLEVTRAVLSKGYDLLIKPVENPDWLQRLFGSDDMHLLRKCPCPVWMIHAAEKSDYDNIIAAIDFDPTQPDITGQGANQQILACASSLALSDFAALHLVHAWDAPAEMLLRSWSNNPLEDSKNYVEAERLRHHDGLSYVSASLRQQLGDESYNYLSPRLHLLQGAPRQLIPELANRIPADLVVMGTVARTGIAGLFIGNTAEAILDQLQCSVLAIKPPGFVSPVKLE